MTAFPRRSKQIQNADLRAVKSHISPGDGALFVHAQHKRRVHAVITRAQWDRREVAVAAQSGLVNNKHVEQESS